MMAAVLFAATGGPAEAPAVRAKPNYEMPICGQKMLGDLSPVERAEVTTLDQLLRRTLPRRGNRPRMRIAERA